MEEDREKNQNKTPKSKKKENSNNQKSSEKPRGQTPKGPKSQGKGTPGGGSKKSSNMDRKSTEQKYVRGNNGQNQDNRPRSQSMQGHRNFNSNVFEPYMSPTKIRAQGLQTENLGPGSLLEGTLRINPKSYEDGFVCSPDSASDIYIRGIRDRNRALHGDSVIVEIYPESKWNVLHENIQDYLDNFGKEEDFQILLKNAVFNVKKEVESSGIAPTDSRTTSMSENPQSRSTSFSENPQSRTTSFSDNPLSRTTSLSENPQSRTTSFSENNQSRTTSFSENPQSRTTSVSENPPSCSEEGPSRGVSVSENPEDDSVPELESAESGTAPKSEIILPDLVSTAQCTPTSGDGWASKNISSAPWDTSGVSVDTFGQKILSEVQFGKKTRRGKRGCKKKDSQGSAAVAPDELEELDDYDQSDYHSDQSLEDDIETKIEDEAFRLAQLGINPETRFKEQYGISNLEEDKTTADTSAQPSTTDPTEKEIAEEVDDDSDDIVIESVDGQTVSQKEKQSRTRRKQRGKKKNKNSSSENQTEAKADLNSSVQIQDDVQTPRKPRFVKPSKVPRVEYSLDDVLKHPLAAGFLQRTGKVVNILEFKHTRVAAGTIKLMADKNPKVALFSPTDSRVPRMKVPMSQCPPDFLRRSQDFTNTMFVARLDTWEATNSAYGSIIRSLGENSDIKVRTEGLLLANSIDYADFPDSVLKDLPDNHATWSIPEQEIRVRRDFRPECVFTIDPLTARDLDDALSVTQQEDGNFRVGVHIADVSYFVKEGTELDSVAADRTTSTYLVQQVIPMLPRPLCENLCSLNPGEDRLTYTVEWTMNPEGEILSEWFGRTVIRSCVKLAYEHAQSMIDEPTRTDWADMALPPIQEPYSEADICVKVNLLQHLALKLRKRREEKGYLRLNQPKLCFSLNPDTGLPDGFKLHEHKHSNKLIEEFMLLANMAVARKIYKSFPRDSVLRRHPPPKPAMLETTLATMNAMGMEIAVNSAKDMGESIARISGCPIKSAVVNCLFSKPMNLAQYFCTGMVNELDYHHYALNVPFYTHFTSPIRRYPDIMVHRLLDHAVRGTKPEWEMNVTQQQCNHCNDKRLAAKWVGEASAELFLGLFIAESGPVSQVGSVVNVLDHALDVLLVELGITKRVYMDKLNISRFSIRRVNAVNYVDLVWRDGSKQTLTIFSRVDVTLQKSEKPFEFTAVIEAPSRTTDEVVVID